MDAEGRSRRRPFDDVWVELQTADSAQGSLMRATLQRRGRLAFDLFSHHQEQLPTLSELHHLQNEYLALVDEYHSDVATDLPAFPPEPDRLLAFGRRVATLLPLAIQRDLAAALYHARRRGRGMRLTLELAPELRDLLVLPWELLVLPLTRAQHVEHGAMTMLLREPDVMLVRQVRGVGHHVRPQLPVPLTIQAFAAVPRGEKAISLEATRAAVRALPGGHDDAFWYEGKDTLRLLEERLRERNPRIVHLLCHGQRRQTLRGPRSDLIFTRDDGGIHRVSAFDLAPVLRLAPDLQMVILEACYAGAGTLGAGASPDEREALEAIALALIRQGVPTVIAMQGPVAQAAAGAFAAKLYAELQVGRSLDEAIGVARVAMMRAGGMIDWSLPVVYQGSGRPEPSLWHHRLADRIEGALFDHTFTRPARALVAALSIAMFVTAVVRWLFAPGPAAEPAELILPLGMWTAIGLGGPGLVAVLAGVERDRRQLTRAERRAARFSVWIGAYGAYGLAGLAGLTLLIAAWTMGLFSLMPPAYGALLLGVVCVGALLMSYVGARSQASSAAVLAPQYPELFAGSGLTVVMVGMLGLIGAPLLTLLLPGSPLAFLLEPAPAALGLALALSSLVVALRR